MHLLHWSWGEKMAYCCLQSCNHKPEVACRAWYTYSLGVMKTNSPCSGLARKSCMQNIRHTKGLRPYQACGSCTQVRDSLPNSGRQCGCQTLGPTIAWTCVSRRFHLSFVEAVGIYLCSVYLIVRLIVVVRTPKTTCCCQLHTYIYIALETSQD